MNGYNSCTKTPGKLHSNRKKQTTDTGHSEAGGANYFKRTIGRIFVVLGMLRVFFKNILQLFHSTHRGACHMWLTGNNSGVIPSFPFHVRSSEQTQGIRLTWQTPLPTDPSHLPRNIKYIDHSDGLENPVVFGCDGLKKKNLQFWGTA